MQIMAGKYPGIVKTKLDGVNQLDYLTGKSEKSARDVFFYYAGSTPSAVRYKNWKFYYTMSATDPIGGLRGQRDLSLDPDRQHQARPLRDRRRVGRSRSPSLAMGGALASPSTAYLYDWNMLPIGQLLWQKELDVLPGVSAAAGAGELQPGAGILARRCENIRHAEPMSR